MPRVSYPFAVGRIKALETKLLDSARWARLNEASYGEAVRILAESGYGSSASKTDPEAMIRAEMKETAALIAELSPAPDWTGLLLLPTDIHNLKVLYKGEALGKEVRSLLLEGGSIPPEKLQEAFAAGGEGLPESFQAAIAEARGADSLLTASAAFDRAYFTQAEEILKKHKNPLLSRYFAAKADFANVMSAVRARKLSWGGPKLRAVWLPFGTLPLQAGENALAGPENDLAAALSKGEFASLIRPVLEEYLQTGDTTRAEERFGEEERRLLSENQDDPFSIGPVIGYYLARESEGRRLRVLFARKA